MWVCFGLAFHPKLLSVSGIWVPTKLTDFLIMSFRVWHRLFFCKLHLACTHLVNVGTNKKHFLHNFFFQWHLGRTSCALKSEAELLYLLHRYLTENKIQWLHDDICSSLPADSVIHTHTNLFVCCPTSLGQRGACSGASCASQVLPLFFFLHSLQGTNACIHVFVGATA